MEEAGIYRQTGLKNVKCFGRAMSFANHMKELPGVIGVEAFVSDKSVKVYYDKDETSETAIKAFMFTPVTRIISAPLPETTEVSVSEFSVDQFFDPTDARMLTIRAAQHPGILAFETLFGEPVHTVFYFDANVISEKEIGEVIEAQKVVWETDGSESVTKTNFEVASVSSGEKLSLEAYLAKMYEPVEMTFNGFEDYEASQMNSLRFDFPQARDPNLADMPWYFLSHMSNNRGVVGFVVTATNKGFVLDLKFVPQLTDSATIIDQVNKPQLSVHLSDGTEEVLDNPYRFGLK